MKAVRTIKVTPIHGWGWVIAGAPRFEVPEPFVVQLEHAEARRWSGFVLDGGHEFSGRRVSLSQRHVDWAGHVNIVVEPFDPAGQLSTGFGTLSELPSAGES